MLVILRSLGIVCIVSSVCAFFLGNTKFDFARYFVAATLLQFIIYTVYCKVVELFEQNILNERLKEFTKQGKEVTCPCPKGLKHFIPIQLDQDNSYRCQDCKRGVIVDVDVKTFLETEMLTIPKAEAAIADIYENVKMEHSKQDGTTIKRA